MHDHEVMRNALSRGEVLLVATSASALPTGSQTGAWISEIAVPYTKFQKAGFSTTIASPNGGEVPVDPASLNAPMSDAEAACVKQFMADDAAKQMMAQSVPMAKIENVATYSGIFMAGGHGASMDFPSNPALQQCVMKALRQGVAVAALCHGNAVFASEEMGKLIKGKRVAAFTDEEERAVGKEGEVPFLLESRLRELGADVVKGPAGQESVVVDGHLATGANPASAAKLAQEFISLMDRNYPACPSSPRSHHPGTLFASELPTVLGVEPIVPPGTTSPGGTAAGTGTSPVPGSMATSAAPAAPTTRTMAQAVTAPTMRSTADPAAAAGMAAMRLQDANAMPIDTPEGQDEEIVEPYMVNVPPGAQPSPGTQMGNDAPASA